MVAHWNSAATIKAQEPFVIRYHKADTRKAKKDAIDDAEEAVRAVLDREGRNLDNLRDVLLPFRSDILF